ncbi:MAG: VWA domain-containing protein [Clostridia bacterium]|nr:VWA domain-containing protein [Clostridia bacterium]
MKKGLKYKLLFSGAFAAVGFLCCLLNYKITADTPVGCILWTAEVFAVIAVLGYLGVEFTLWLKRKDYKAVGRKSIALGLVLSLVSGAVIGASGQLLYSLRLHKYAVDSDDGKTPIKSNVVFMVDCSASMANQYASCVDATCEALDTMDENNYFRFAAFSSYNIDEKNHATEHLPVTSSNRDSLKDKIKAINAFANSNNFEIALDFALETIKDSDYDSRKNIIIMISDAVGKLNSFDKDELEKYDAKLYVLHIKNADASNASKSKMPLLDIADKTFEISVEDGNGAVNIYEMTSSVENMFKAANEGENTKKKLILTEDMLLFAQDINVIRAVVSIIFFGLFAVAAGCVYYFSFDIKMILLNFLTGTVAALLSFIYYPLGIAVLLLVVAGGFVKYEITEETGNV